MAALAPPKDCRLAAGLTSSKSESESGSAALRLAAVVGIVFLDDDAGWGLDFEAGVGSGDLGIAMGFA